MNSRACIYHRVSTSEQDPALARAELHGAATARSMSVELDVEETGSGARNDRPGLLRVLEAARRHRIDAVLVWKLDRFGRSALDLLGNIRTLEDAGVRFIATSQGIDIRPDGDAMSRLILTVLAGVAEFERGLIIERTHLGLAKARRAGKHIGRPLGAHAPDPVEVGRMRAAGASWRVISLTLGCTVAAARRAAKRAVLGRAETGVQETPAPPVEKGREE